MRYAANLVPAILALSSVGQAAPADTAAAPEIITIPFPDAATLASLANSTGAWSPDDAHIKVARMERGLDKRQLVDRRYRYPDTGTYPHRAVGRFDQPNGAICTGFMVGPRHVLTVRHCLAAEPLRMVFTPRYLATNYGRANVARVYQYPKADHPCDQATDYVVFALGEPLGDRTGWMGVSHFDGRYNAGQFCNLGYPGDRDGGGQMWATDGVSVHFVGTGCGNTVNYQTNAFTSGGMSGGPAWSWGSDNLAYALGPLTGVSSQESAFVGGQGVINLVLHARNDWP